MVRETKIGEGRSNRKWGEASIMEFWVSKTLNTNLGKNCRSRYILASLTISSRNPNPGTQLKILLMFRNPIKFF